MGIEILRETFNADHPFSFFGRLLISAFCSKKVIEGIQALDLLENVELHAIIIPKISNEELFLARLVGDDENNQFHGIAAFLEAFRWRSFVFLYEDTVYARQAQTYIHDILKENQGKEERRVGFWTSAHGLMKEINPAINSSSKILETIIWPGLSLTTPESWLVHMSGKSFRIGIPANARFSELLSLGHDWRHNITTFSGFCIDVFHAAVDRLPYKIAIEYIPFYKHYGTYNDLLYQVHLQNYDAAAGDITILSNMSAYVDFTVPYTESGVGVVVKLDDGDHWFFLKPLSADLWITSACFFFLTGFIVWLVEHRINEEFQAPPTQQIGTALWFAASTLVYAHSKLPLL
ncbi:hypothetical protein DH2020_006945 [Rehmannia glutinosa]|uniref:Ionotropic glutamate receptor C-terminal domain-containing protein n=1 Tax=Rehmannia glutinosa TaxID=99300 RepID=A0ABR0XKV4_REHGL